MTLEEIRALLKALRERLAARTDELRNMPTAEEFTAEHATRAEAIDAELNTAHAEGAERGLLDEIEHHEGLERTMVRALEMRERGAIERGDGNGFGGDLLRRVDPFDGTEVRSLRPADARGRALKVLEDRDSTSHLEQRQVDHLARLVGTRDRNTDGDHIARRMLLTENPHYRTAFMKVMARPNAVLSSDEQRAVEAFDEFRAMGIGTDAAGGFGVPVVIDPTIILTAQGTPNDFFTLARVEVITNDEWKGVSSAGVTWSFDPEASEVSDDSPTLAQPTVPTHKAQGFIPYSIEVGMDYPGFAAEMSRLLAEGYSELVVNKFTLGTGVGEPTGIITALNGTASEILNATTGAIAVGDVNGLWAALPIRFRTQRAAWMSDTAVNNAIQGLGAGNNLSGFTVDFTAEGVMVLKGHKAYLNDYFPELGGVKDGLLIVGDWQNYLIAQRAGMSVELVPHLVGANRRPTGQRGWFAWARVGADSVNDNGFRMLSDDGV